MSCSHCGNDCPDCNVCRCDIYDLEKIMEQMKDRFIELLEEVHKLKHQNRALSEKYDSLELKTLRFLEDSPHINAEPFSEFLEQ